MININYVGFVFSNTGYAIAARNYILALKDNYELPFTIRVCLSKLISKVRLY
jgi:hypothetical protein